jgi:ABC-type microcin C transport system permease subunit YejE
MDKIEQTGPNQVSLTTTVVDALFHIGAFSAAASGPWPIFPRRDQLHDEAAVEAFAPWLAQTDPDEIKMLDRRIAPFETLNHPLGTGAFVGSVLGLTAGYKGGWWDITIMRLADAALGFPTILVTMIIVTILGAGIENIVLAVAITVWARFARMIRGDVLAIKELDFITSARIAGVAAPVIIARHIFPNTVNTLLVITSLQVGQVILLEASLSFLGLGLPPGAPAWGIMVAEGRSVILEVWWLSLLPGLAITVGVLAFNFFGDWVRDTLDPKLRRA